MTETPPESPNTEDLLLKLRRKEGNWIEWGHSCQTLQKSGYTQQAIFEATGFEPIQQNQIIVAAQVYDTILKQGVSDEVRSHFSIRGSDSLYELRILTQPERAAAAQLLVDKKLDSEEAREVARAMKDFSRLAKPPESFSDHPGDQVAYQLWKTAKQKTDLQERSRLIARGLRFAQTDAARSAIEQLLTDFTVVPVRSAPRLPLYRFESDEDLPKLLPVVGKLPLTKADLQAVPVIEETGAFGIVQFAGAGAWMAIPGWQVLRQAEDPIALVGDSDRLPTPIEGKPEEVVIVIDRAQRDWNEESYFVVDEDEQLQIRWFDQSPSQPLLGRVILIVRPKKVLDEDYTKELWQIDE